MIIFRFLIPFLYSVMLGSVWSMWSGKKFSSSLAPAFMTHILLIFFSGLIFNRLSIGIYAGIIITFIMFTIYIVKNLISGKNNSVNILNYSKDLWNNGLMIFTFLYIFCFITNQDKNSFHGMNSHIGACSLKKALGSTASIAIHHFTLHIKTTFLPSHFLKPCGADSVYAFLNQTHTEQYKCLCMLCFSPCSNISPSAKIN